MVAVRGGYGVTRGSHYIKLSLQVSNALLLSFSRICFVLSFLSSFVLFLLCFVFMLSLEVCTTTTVDAPLIFYCPADHILD